MTLMFAVVKSGTQRGTTIPELFEKAPERGVILGSPVAKFVFNASCCAACTCNI